MSCCHVPEALGAAERGGRLLCQKGVALWRAGDRRKHWHNSSRAVAIAPSFADAWNNRGAALQGLSHPEEALESYDRALQIQAGHVEARFNRATILEHMRDPGGALAEYDRVLALAPGYAAAWCHRGTVLWDIQRAGEALSSYDQAVTLKSGFAEALFKRGLKWAAFHDLPGAIADLEQALRADPQYPYAEGDLLHLLMHGGIWRDFDRETARIGPAVRAGREVIGPFSYMAISDNPADLQACSAISRQQYPAAPAAKRPASRQRAKIRVGYLSGEFREQATAYLTAGLYERHDRSRFEITAFDNGQGDNSPMRRRLEAALIHG